MICKYVIRLDNTGSILLEHKNPIIQAERHETVFIRTYKTV